MFRSGDEIEHPTAGIRLVFRRTAAETRGRAVVVEAFLQPNGFVPRECVRPHQELRLEVLRGSLGASVDGHRSVAAAGTRLEVPAGVRHRFWNTGDDIAHLVTEVTPALRFESQVEATFVLAAEAARRGRVRPRLLRRAVLAELHFETVRPAFPPAPLQRLWLAAAAPLGRALGYDRLPPAPARRPA